MGNLSKLRKLEGAVNIGDNDPLANCLQTSSPSVNWAFANSGHGLPRGFSIILYGPPKGGKSIICNSLIGQLHRDDPEAVAITFNTELRGEIQNNNAQLKKFGIDKDRFIPYDVNQPELVFDRIEHDIAEAIEKDGEKIKLIIIDSLTGIQGRRTANAESILDQNRGDQALTIQEGLLRILPTIRKHKIGLVMTAHLRAEQDVKEQMRGNSTRMAAAWAVRHIAEYFALIEKNQAKAGKVNLSGEEFTDPTVLDFMEKSAKTGHKIRFKITGNSNGVDGRTAEFTLDFGKGIINQYEEIFQLGKNLGIITQPKQGTYQYKDQSWRGIVNCLTAIRDSELLQQDIMKDVYALDAQ